MTAHSNILIVGAGQAGGRAAQTLRAAGFAGAITVVGAEAHAPYERPALSKALLCQAGVATPFMFEDGYFSGQNIRSLFGCEAVALDRTLRRVALRDGEELSYEQLLIATGSRVRTVSAPRHAEVEIHYLRTIDDSRAIEQRLGRGVSVAIVGGGFIGLEAAASAALRGCSVTVIETADRLLPRLGCPQASAQVLAYHQARAIDFRLGASIAHFGRDGGRAAIVLRDGVCITADLIIAGVGVTPETQLAANAGLDVDDGVLTDACGRTSDPLIFAAGDVTRHFNPLLGRYLRLESWQNANSQSLAAARTMLGIATEYAEIPWIWSDQGELNLQVAGAPQRIDQVLLRGEDLQHSGISVLQFEQGRLVGAVTLNRAGEMPVLRRLLASPAPVPIDKLADTSVPLRRALAAATA